MAEKRTRRASIEGIVRTNRQQGGQVRPRLDPFGAPQSRPKGIGLTPGSGPGLSVGSSKKSTEIMDAPHFDLDLPEDNSKPKKKHFGRKDRGTTGRHNKLKMFKRVSFALLTLMIVGGGFMGYTTLRATHQIFKGGAKQAIALQKEVDPTKLKGEGDGRINILLTGIGGQGHSGPYLTDTLLVASLDPFAKEVSLLSVPRDLWVTIKNVGSSKINSVLPNSMDRHDGSISEGMKTLEGVISTSLDIPIHYYTLVDFTAFKDAINTVGGVDINVKTKLIDTNVAWENHNNPLIADVGLQHMDGAKALLYSRSRYGSARGDFDRTQRQREVMVALKDKVFTLGTFGNPVKMTQLISTAGNHVQTDLSVTELKHLYDIIKGVQTDKIRSLGLADPPHELVKTGNINGASVVIPVAGANNYTEIQTYVHSALIDGFIKKENASISLINASGSPSYGKTKLAELKSYGYNITATSDAATPQTATTITEVSRNKAPYTKKYLENRLKVTAKSGKAPAGQASTVDFVVILGSNAVSQ